MIAAIHQPNFMPWLGYFYKMLHCDVFVFLDDVPFSKGSYTNRVKIRNVSGNASTWLTMPVKTSGCLNQMIYNVQISDEEWKTNIIAKISASYRKSPYYKKYIDQIYCAIDNISIFSLASINKSIILAISSLLDISPNFILSSELNGICGVSTDKLISICKKIKATTYLSGIGGSKYLDCGSFQDVNIELKFIDFLKNHDDMSLSILDILFRKGHDVCKRILHE